MNLRVLLLVVVLPGAAALAQVSLPRILASHMVVQRDLPVHVWGMAAPGEDVTVHFRGEMRSTKAGPLGPWSLYLKPGAAGGPFQMIVEGEPASGGGAVASPQRIELDDVLVGDVWVASGQSNMEFQLSQAATAEADLPHAANDHIRLLIVKKRAVDFAQDDIETDGWAASAPDTAKDFSAVAWYFAREIEQREQVPVGVIDSPWGGTPAEAWTRVAALGADATLAPVFVSWGKLTDAEANGVLEEKRRDKLREEAQAAGRPAPQFPWHVRPLESWGPGMLWNGMIAPLTPFAIRGVIWYQGESNGTPDGAPLYQRIFSTLIQDWRREWGVGDFPFLFVQIANFNIGPGDAWAVLRDQQRRTLSLRNTAMAVTVDIGNPDNVHPTDKVDVGRRLALGARAIAYGEDVEYSGPMFRQATPEGSELRVWFDHDAEGLMTKGDEVTGFEVAGADGKYVPAKARIDGNTVVVSSEAVTEPLLVRYGWANSPVCNLFNGEGLPASPFTSEK